MHNRIIPNSCKIKPMTNFIGVKIALLFKGKLLVIHRDNRPDVRFANMWDFAGGGREHDETPQQCIIREVHEELGIALSPATITWQKMYPSMHDKHLKAYFMVAELSAEQIEAVKFGNEGQGWKLISVDEFMNDPLVIEHLKGRLQDYLAASNIAVY